MEMQGKRLNVMNVGLVRRFPPLRFRLPFSSPALSSISPIANVVKVSCAFSWTSRCMTVFLCGVFAG